MTAKVFETTKVSMERPQRETCRCTGSSRWCLKNIIKGNQTIEFPQIPKKFWGGACLSVSAKPQVSGHNGSVNSHKRQVSDHITVAGPLPFLCDKCSAQITFLCPTSAVSSSLYLLAPDWVERCSLIFIYHEVQVGCVLLLFCVEKRSLSVPEKRQNDNICVPLLLFSPGRPRNTSFCSWSSG